MSLTSAFFLPQIIHNAFRGQRYKFDSAYIFLLGVIRIIIPLYVRSCPVSIFRLTPDYVFLDFYVGAIAFQVNKFFFSILIISGVGSLFTSKVWIKILYPKLLLTTKI